MNTEIVMHYVFSGIVCRVLMNFKLVYFMYKLIFLIHNVFFFDWALLQFADASLNVLFYLVMERYNNLSWRKCHQTSSCYRRLQMDVLCLKQQHWLTAV
jgi:hypothetical protein